MKQMERVARHWKGIGKVMAVCLALLLLQAGGLGAFAGQTAPCTISLMQDTAYVGQQAKAQITLADGLSWDAVSCAWAYRIGSEWQQIPCFPEAGQVQITPHEGGWLKLVVTVLHADGSASTCTSNTMPVLHPVHPVTSQIEIAPLDTAQGPGLRVAWAIQTQETAPQVQTHWQGSGTVLSSETALDGLSGSATFLPEKDGKVWFVVELTDKNGQTSSYESGLAIVHTYKNGNRKIVTSAMLKDKVKELAQTCKNQAKDAYSQAKWLHDYLAWSAFYDFGYTIYDAHGVLLLGTGVCQSFALAYQMLLNEVGIPNRYVTGIGGGDGKKDFHAWNLVNIEGNWYHVDVTWDEAGGHTYFLKSDAYMKKTHRWADSLYPEAPFNYGQEPKE